MLSIHENRDLQSGYDGRVVAALVTNEDMNGVPNHYPGPDGTIPQLDSGAITTGELISYHLSGSQIVMMFNLIPAPDFNQGRFAETANPRAVPIAGDDMDAKLFVTKLLDQFGFDAVDGGPLVENRRF